MPKEGLFAVVRAAGEVRVGDNIEVLALGDGGCDRTPPSAIAEFEAEKAAEAAARENGSLPTGRGRGRMSRAANVGIEPPR